MNITKRLVVGMALFALVFFTSFPTVLMGTASAISNITEAQLKTVAQNAKIEDDNTIKAKLGDGVITFEKTTAVGLAKKFEAQNLDCGGENAYIQQVVPSIATQEVVEEGIFLFGKFKQGNGCSPVQKIKLNINKEQFEQAASATEGGSSPSCDTKLTSPLSWILCPVIELGANFTDYVYTNVVKPLLSEVPVTTNPDDNGYKAWKQFRVIGNILLVGTLLAVVYAQVKGDR